MKHNVIIVPIIPSGETKIGDLGGKRTIVTFEDKDVLWLQVSVNDACSDHS